MCYLNMVDRQNLLLLSRKILDKYHQPTDDIEEGLLGDRLMSLTKVA